MEDTQTGDGRVWAPGAWEWDDAALAAEEVVFQWDIEDDGGHLGAVEIGRLTSLTRDGRVIGCTGWVDDEWDHAAEWIARCEEAGSMGVSAVWDDYEVQVIDTTLEVVEDPETGEAVAVAAAAGDPDPGEDAGLVVVEARADEVLERWVRSRFRMLTSVDMPAFAECRVTLDAAEGEPAAEEPEAEEPADEAATAAATAPCGCGGHVTTACSCQPGSVVAAGAPAIPVAPPRAWFQYDAALFASYRAQVASDEFGTARISDDGEVYGYVAPWGVCHTGYHGECVTTPRSASGYAHFLTGYVVCDDGTEVATGPLTLGAGHADLSLSYAGTVDHYDNVCSAFADITCGEDEFGVWFHGALRPNVSPDMIRVARGSALSGDWRPVGNSLEMVAALAVNSPGFPIPRARVASSGRLMALVSAGLPADRRRWAGSPAEVEAAVEAAEAMERRVAALEAMAASSARKRLDAQTAAVRDRTLARLRG